MCKSCVTSVLNADKMQIPQNVEAAHEAAIRDTKLEFFDYYRRLFGLINDGLNLTKKYRTFEKIIFKKSQN